MNMLLIEEESPNNIYIIKGKQFTHIKDHLKIDIGENFIAGILNSKIGKAKVLSIGEESLKIQFYPEKNPPKPINIKLIMAIPRPKVLKRVLKHIVTFGIKEIYLINSWSVEKSFLKSSIIKNREFDKYIKDGLEQSVDTIYPKIEIYEQFKPFVEDILPEISKNCVKYLAHPKNAVDAPYKIKEKTIVAIGPDRGFNNFEVKKFEKQKFKTVTLGDRILHQESAIPYILGRFI